MSWFLRAIVAGLNAIIDHMHTVVAKHLLGMEAESKRQDWNYQSIKTNPEDSPQFLKPVFDSGEKL